MAPGSRDLFRYLLEKLAAFSGISGVQPKILVRDETAFAEMQHTGQRLSHSYKGATHIVKLARHREIFRTGTDQFAFGDSRSIVMNTE